MYKAIVILVLYMWKAKRGGRLCSSPATQKKIEVSY